MQQQTLRQIYDWTRQYHASDFPVLLNYQNFVSAIATMLPVCKLVRRRWHRGCQSFKLHASIDNDGKLCAAVFSSANLHDSRAIPYLFNEHTRIPTEAPSATIED